MCFVCISIVLNLISENYLMTDFGDSYIVALAVQESFCQLDDTESVVQDFKKNFTLDGQSQWPE